MNSKTKLLVLAVLFMSFYCTNAFAQPKKFPAPASADTIRNPLKATEASIAAGKKLYTLYCVTCHGAKGKGDGIAAPGLAKPPADHSSAFIQGQKDGALFWAITAGNNPMPAYKTALTATQRWQLVNYIRTLAKGFKAPVIVAKVAEPKPAVKTSTAVAAKPVADKPETIAAVPVEKENKPVADTIATVHKEKQIETVTVTPQSTATAENKTDTAVEPVKTDDAIILNTDSKVSAHGQNNFAIFGNAEMTFFADKNGSHFGDVNFKPIFLWKISDKLFVEAEPEFETGEGSVNIGLEYANMVYIVNSYLTLHAGRFLPKFGAYRGRMGEGFINRFSTAPVGFGDGGIGAKNEVGVGAQGGFGAGSAKINYELYLCNGSQILTDPDNAGQFEYEAYAANNNAKAVGGRIGVLPFSNSSLEIAYSFQNKNKTGEKGSPYANVGVLMQAFDLNYWGHLLALKSDVRIIAEWKHQKVDNVIYYDADSTAYTFNNSPTAYYVAGAIRPSHLKNSFARNLEFAIRYSEFKRPANAAWGGSNTNQAAFSLDYWLKWNTVLKLTYQTEKDVDNAFYAQIVFGF